MSSEEGVSAFPEDDNLFKWVGTIEGPQGTVSYFTVTNNHFILCTSY